MKKAFDQTVRDLKREVNKKVLKVPGIEQKILDATSNEPWGPHGSHLADIAQATRNYQEFQMIMTVIWKRINDTGKNWRHVYKALTVLEYLVAHGSERVIDEIKEHAYQLSTLSDFQYIDSSGRDQGSNVRRKSQSLVALVNDKERVQEVRQKAFANKDKYRSTFSTGGPGSYSSSGGYGDRYDDDRYEGQYGSRDKERNGYGRERDWANRDDERYGRAGDSYNREGDRYGRDPDEHYGKENYRDDDYRGRGNDDNQYGAKNRRSIDRDTDKSYEEDDRYSSRSSGGKAGGFSQNERHLERKLSDATSAPPSYEEATKDTRNHINDERDGGSAAAPVQKATSPVAPKAASPAGSTTEDPDHSKFVATPNNDTDGFDEFDPRGSASAVQPTASPYVDFFGSFSASDPANSSALVPVASATATSGPDMPSNSGTGMNFMASTTTFPGSSQPVEDPFGDSPFKATTSENFPAQPQSSIASGSFHPGSIGCAQPTAPFASADTKSGTVPSFNFEDALGGITYTPSIPNSHPSSVNPATQSLELPGAQATNDTLDVFLPPGGSVNLTAPLPVHPVGLMDVQTAQVNLPQTVVSAPIPPPGLPVPSQMAQTAAPVPTNVQGFPSLIPQSSAMASGYSSQAAPISAGSTIKTQPSKDKLELKSTVWADTLSRGLVDLNISGPKTNPLADIGVDFDSINRMEKRKEAKSSAAPMTSTITMGKPMGTGTGTGRAAASGLAPPPNPMMGSTMGMGIGGSPGIGMGGYGGNMNPPMGMGLGMNVGVGVGVGSPMRPPMGMPPPGPGMAGGGYNPMMGMGNYGPQQPYGGRFR